MYMIVEVSQYVAVASFSEAWIEIVLTVVHPLCLLVASFSEAWIEIFYRSNSANALPVASFSEAWIEMLTRSTIPLITCRLLLGGVD